MSPSHLHYPHSLRSCYIKRIFFYRVAVNLGGDEKQKKYERQCPLGHVLVFKIRMLKYWSTDNVTRALYLYTTMQITHFDTSWFTLSRFAIDAMMMMMMMMMRERERDRVLVFLNIVSYEFSCRWYYIVLPLLKCTKTTRKKRIIMTFIWRAYWPSSLFYVL